jgi:hypothetical protein
VQQETLSLPHRLTTASTWFRSRQPRRLRGQRRKRNRLLSDGGTFACGFNLDTLFEFSVPDYQIMMHTVCFGTVPK